jgi:hypothetical protein
MSACFVQHIDFAGDHMPLVVRLMLCLPPFNAAFGIASRFLPAFVES